MNIYTLNVGQGQLVAITGKNEAIVVDTFLPLNAQNQDTEHVIGALADIFQGKNFVGAIITGFDDDHFCDVGVKTVLNKYRPDWVMYPRYYKDSNAARACFKTIEAFLDEKELRKISVDLADPNNSRVYDDISKDFSFEVFSPHKRDMNSSNNCSIVCKVTERSTGATYLITGDTEIPRWDSILRLFKTRLKADVMAAPHHGSKNGITKAVLEAVSPDTVLISAGVSSQYGHPHDEAIELYHASARATCRTNKGTGQSILTVANGSEVKNSVWTRAKK